MTITEAANLLREVTDQWCGSGSPQSLDELLLEAARNLSPDPIFNLAAFLRFNSGDELSGMSDIEMIQEATLISRILGDKRWLS